MNFRLIMDTCVSELLWKIWGINVFLFALCGNPQICISNYLCINIEKYKENSKKVVASYYELFVGGNLSIYLQVGPQEWRRVIERVKDKPHVMCITV